jgi:uncharacterized protein (TIGR03032 family)
MEAQMVDQPWLDVTASRNFPDWLAETRVSLACTTYHTGKLIFIGQGVQGRLSVFDRTFNRCMGLWGDGQTLWMSSLFQMWRFENILPAGAIHDGYDRVYVPRAGFTTGDLDIHDIVVETGGRVVFVNTRFGCLATLHERESFTPLWKPPFLSKLAAEDRCHLNGLALDDGRARYVTAVSASDVADGWRDRRRDGGLVIDVRTNQVVASGLSMPHSPRMHQGQLWLLNSGTGEFGRIDLASGKFEPIAFCPGYMRGLAFVGNYAVVGLSRPRHEKTFAGLKLDETLAAKGAEARCGMHVIDLTTGDTVHWLRIEGMVSELYDVVALPGVVKPMAIGFKSDEIHRVLTMSAPGTL